MLWKRKLLILLIWCTVSGVTYFAVKRLPVLYKSESLILIDSQKIPEKFVSSTVASDLQERITSIQQQILSGTLLKQLITEFNLYPRERRTKVEEEILEQMRGDILITLERGGRGNTPGAFRIGFQGRDPGLVARVANRLTNLCIEQNAKTREVQAEGTSQFLESQLQDAKKRLDEQEAAVSAYKLKHNGELPQQENSLAGTLARLQLELEANRDAMDRANQTKVVLETSLNTASAELALHARGARLAAPAPLLPLPGSPEPLPAPKRSDTLKAQLEVLRTRYRDEHPDVKRLRTELAEVVRLEADEARALDREVPANSTAPARLSAKPVSTAPESQEAARAREQVATLGVRIGLIDKELENRRLDQERILRDISTYQKRVERIPIREQEMSQITRDYEISKANYRSLLDKKIAAEMATDMERRQQSERFMLLDPPKVPEKPFKPKYPVLYAAGTAFGLMLGVLAGVALELRQNVLLGEWELPEGTVILARLPGISIAPGSRLQGGA
jgi:polysaccharide chain length determinant protein (PEP-CTERM system associated)